MDLDENKQKVPVTLNCDKKNISKIAPTVKLYDFQPSNVMAP